MKAAPSCKWREVTVAVCTDGEVRLSVNGRRVDRPEFDRATENLRAIANAADLVRAVHAAGSLTTRALADAEGIKDTAASMRLKTAYALGLLTREREGRHSFRYVLAYPMNQNEGPT